MKKILFLIVVLLTTSCSQKPLRSTQDCSFACAARACESLGTQVQGCICQEREQK